MAPCCAATAREELSDLWQRNKDFVEFIAEFNFCIVPDTRLDEVAVKFALQKAISMELRTLMIHHMVPEKLEDYIKVLQELDLCLCALNTTHIHKPTFSRFFLRSAAYPPVSSAQPGYIPPNALHSFVTSSSTSSVSCSKTAFSLGPMSMNLSRPQDTSNRGGKGKKKTAWAMQLL